MPCHEKVREGGKEGGEEGGRGGTHRGDVVVDDREGKAFLLNKFHQPPRGMDPGEGGVDGDEEEDGVELLELLQLLLALLPREGDGVPRRLGREGGRARRREGRKVVDGNGVGDGRGSKGGGRDEHPQATFLQAAKGGATSCIIQGGRLAEEDGVAGGDVLEWHAHGCFAACWEGGQEGGREGGKEGTSVCACEKEGGGEGRRKEGGKEGGKEGRTQVVVECIGLGQVLEAHGGEHATIPMQYASKIKSLSFHLQRQGSFPLPIIRKIPLRLFPRGHRQSAGCG